MRVDLEDLVRKARRWNAALTRRGTTDEADARIDHIAANSPVVTLALVERIETLEAFIAAIIETPLGLDERAVAGIRDLLDRGVVTGAT